MELLNDILSGLHSEQKKLPTKLLYDEYGSQLFDKICELDEYYPTRTEMQIMEENINEITGIFPDNSLLIEYGSGSSLKTRLLLDHLDSLSGYVPIDISEDHLQASVRSLQEDYPVLDIYPLAADYTRPFILPETKKSVEHRVAYFPGSTIGNFSKDYARKFLESVARICGEGGDLLIGFDMKKDINVLKKAYNDSCGVTAEFNLNILNHINREFDFNFDSGKFKHDARYNEDHDRIEMHLVSLQDQKVSNNGSVFTIKKDESILTEYSHKFSQEEIEKLVLGLFEVKKTWTDPRNYFSIQFLEVIIRQ